MADLADGQMRGVTVEGKRVLVVNLGGEFFALEGVCTHERANLDEGALYEGVVYCPLHYSAFDVRSGDVLGPPAEKSACTYAVRVDEGKVLVSLTADPAAAASYSGARGSGGGAETVDIRTEPLPRTRPWHSRVSEGIDSLRWLQRLANRVMAALTWSRAHLAPAWMLDLLHGRWMGHSLHPALSDLPIGLWSSALLLYLINMPHPAAILSVVGTASAFAAAATGAADLSVAEGHERRAGVLHGLLMTLALLLHAGSAALYYFADAMPLAIALTAIGLAITLGAAYIGGHLVFGHGAMVNHTIWPPGPVQWIRTIEEADLDTAPEHTRAVDIGDKKVLLHRSTDGHITAIHDACSHSGASLSLGKICDGIATCPWHDSKFRLTDGAVVQGPAIYPQPVFEVRINSGWIELRATQ